MYRRTVLIAIIFLLVYTAAIIVTKAVRGSTTQEEWRVRLGSPVSMEVVEGSPFSDQYLHDYNRLHNEILFADQWAEEEVEQLLAFVEIPPIRDHEITNTAEFSMESLEMWLGRDEALAVIAERLDVGAPIDSTQIPALIAALMDGVEQRESFRYFSAAVVHLIDAGLADESGPYRDAIMAIHTSGKQIFSGRGTSVAENIERQLKARNAW